MENRIKAQNFNHSLQNKIKSIQKNEHNELEFFQYLTDESRLSAGKNIETVFFPGSEEEISSIVQKCVLEKKSLTIAGARTGIVGGSVPLEGMLLSLEKMNKILGMGFDQQKNQWYLRLEPFVTIEEINSCLKVKDVQALESLTPHSVKLFKLQKGSYFYPVDPTEMNASIGGTVSTNASGARSYKYGPSRNWIKKIRVIIHNGQLLEIERGQYFADENNEFIIELKNHQAVEYIRFQIPEYSMPDVKNAAGIYSKKGMDLIDLFIGSEGIFGIISEIEVWLTEYHEDISNILFFYSEEDALNFVELIRNDKRVNLEFIEYIDRFGLSLIRKHQLSHNFHLDIPFINKQYQAGIFFNFQLLGNQLEQSASIIDYLAQKCNTSLENSWAAHEYREVLRLKKFRHSLPELVNSIISERKNQYPGLHKLGTDMAVPDQYLKIMIDYYLRLLNDSSLEYVMFGHIGNSHLHVNILPRNIIELEKGQKIYELFARKAVELGGSVSAEHGIGKIKKKYLAIMYGHNGILEMKRLKVKLDPLGIFNRNNIFDY